MENFSSILVLEYSPSCYPIEQPPQNHTQSPNFCTLQPLLAYQDFLFFCSDACHRSRVLTSTLNRARTVCAPCDNSPMATEHLCCKRLAWHLLSFF